MKRTYNRTKEGTWVYVDDAGRTQPVTMSEIRDKMMIYGELASGDTQFYKIVKIPSEFGLLKLRLNVNFTKDRIGSVRLVEPTLGILVQGNIDSFELELEA
jgi:hypothetical protein